MSMDAISQRNLDKNMLAILSIVPPPGRDYITYADCEAACKPRPCMETITHLLADDRAFLDPVRGLNGLVMHHRWEITDEGRKAAQRLRTMLEQTPDPVSVPLRAEDIRKATPIEAKPEEHDVDEDIPEQVPGGTTAFSPPPNRASASRDQLTPAKGRGRR